LGFRSIIRTPTAWPWNFASQRRGIRGRGLSGRASHHPPNPGPVFPTVFPDNFPDENFYFDAGAGFDIPAGGALTKTGRAVLVQALEAAFATGPVVEGDQVVFGRLRYKLDVPVAGNYTITTPYGTFTEVVAP